MNGGWSNYTDVSACGATCGDSVKTQRRACNNPIPNEYGSPCDGDEDGDGFEERVVACNLGECPGKQILSFCLEKLSFTLVLTIFSI